MFLILLMFTACQSSSNSTEETAIPPPQTPAENPSPSETDDQLYTWVDQLNIRSGPSTGAQTIATVQSDEALKFTGQKSDNSETIVLRGVAYHEPWFKIITPDEKEGWVFGGAVKRKGETKGNSIIDENNFDFPHFGNFNLKDWQKEPPKDEIGGDAEINTTRYKRGNQILEISVVDVGDYGYGRTHKLMDANNTLLKEREFRFSADVELRELREVVKDFTADPPKQYKRVQTLDKHHSQLNALPMMVNGNWVVGAVE